MTYSEEAELREHILKLRRDLHGKTEENAGLDAMVDGLNTVLEAEVTECSRLRELVAKQAAEIQRFETSLGTTSAERDRLRSELAEVSNGRNFAVDDLRDEQRENEELRTAVVVLKKEVRDGAKWKDMAMQLTKDNEHLNQLMLDKRPINRNADQRYRRVLGIMEAIRDKTETHEDAIALARSGALLERWADLQLDIFEDYDSEGGE